MATVLCFSTVDWDYLWHRPQMVMSSLAGDGHRVLYVDTVGLRSPRLRDAGRVIRRLSRRARAAGRGVYAPRPGIQVWSPLILPWLNSRAVRRVNVALLVRGLRRRLGEDPGFVASGPGAAGGPLPSGAAPRSEVRGGFPVSDMPRCEVSGGSRDRDAAVHSEVHGGSPVSGAARQAAGAAPDALRGTAAQRGSARGAQALAEELIIWVYLPTATVLGCVERLPHRLLVYEAIDALAGNPAGVSRDFTWAERTILERADLVLATSRTLFEEKLPHNSNTHWIPPGVDPVFFAPFTSQQSPPAPDGPAPVQDEGPAHPATPAAGDAPAGHPRPRWADMPAPRIVFYGTVDHRLDLELVRSLAVRHRSWSFVLIGPTRRPTAELSAEPNLHLAGALPHSDLAAHLRHADVLFLPYALDEFTRGIHPAKIYECLALGKPVVATRLPALEEFQDLVYLASDQSGFHQALESAVAEDDPPRVERRRAMARANSWEARYAQIRSLLNAALG